MTLNEASKEFNRLCRKLWADGVKALADHWPLWLAVYLAGPLLTILIEWLIFNG